MLCCLGLSILFIFSLGKDHVSNKREYNSTDFLKYLKSVTLRDTNIRGKTRSNNGLEGVLFTNNV